MMTLIMKQEGLDDDDQDVFKEVMSYLEQALLWRMHTSAQQGLK